MQKYKYYEREVNYYETDQMSVVHHSNYARYLEECRIDLMKHYGLPLHLIEEMGYVIPVLELHCNYRESIRFGQKIRIVPRVEKMTGVKFDFSYTIYDEKMERILHTASTSHCFLNSDFKPVSIKKSEPELYQKMLDMTESLNDGK